MSNDTSLVSSEYFNALKTVKAVREEFEKGESCRWGHGLPGTVDAQLLFMQSAIDKLDDKVGRAAIVENGTPLFTGGTASGESQIRRWMLESDLIEAIIALPTDLFYNTGIQTYVWILSKNKRPDRRGKIQLLDASSICHKLRKPLGNKRNELSPEDRSRIIRLYSDFEENELSKIYSNTEFIYREYTVMQPLQRSYSITEDSIQAMLQGNALKGLWDEATVSDLEDKGVAITDKEQKKLDSLRKTMKSLFAVLTSLPPSAYPASIALLQMLSASALRVMW